MGDGEGRGIGCGGALRLYRMRNEREKQVGEEQREGLA